MNLFGGQSGWMPTLGQKLFYYTAGLLVLLLLATLLVLERSQSFQWEEHLRTQSLSFARLATPELLKRLRGDFSGVKAGGENFDFLAVNRDLISFSLVSSGGRILFRSPLLGGFSVLPLDEEQVAASSPPDTAPRLSTRNLASGGRILLVEVPAYGPTGSAILTARYIFSYASVDQRIAEVRAHFLRILLISVAVSFLLAAVVARRVVGPIRELNRGVLAVAQGDLQTRIEVASKDEIGALARAFNQMAANLAENRSELTNKNIALGEANQELRQMQESLVRAERLAAIGQLAAGVSHEIDNPVGIILGLAELMLEDCSEDDPMRDDLLTIVEECKRCRRITGGLLGFARSSVGEFGEFDLSCLVHDILDSLRPQKLFKSLQISVEGESAVLVMGDADKIRQVLINLCINAAQAMGGEGRLCVRTAIEQGEVVIEVNDTGPGIPEELREKIFEPFFSTKGRGEGTGLGLSICRRLIEGHGGRLQLGRGEAGGASFQLILPLSFTDGQKNFDKGADVSIG